MSVSLGSQCTNSNWFAMMVDSSDPMDSLVVGLTWVELTALLLVGHEEMVRSRQVGPILIQLVFGCLSLGAIVSCSSYRNLLDLFDVETFLVGSDVISTYKLKLCALLFCYFCEC